MAISNLAAGKIKGNYKLIGLLMGAFNKHQKTIETWADDRNMLLTTPTAVQIISEVTGLSEDEILEKEAVPQS